MLSNTLVWSLWRPLHIIFILIRLFSVYVSLLDLDFSFSWSPAVFCRFIYNVTHFLTQSPAFCCSNRHTSIPNLGCKVWINFTVKVVHLSAPPCLKVDHRQCCFQSLWPESVFSAPINGRGTTDINLLWNEVVAVIYVFKTSLHEQLIDTYPFLSKVVWVSWGHKHI